MRLVRLLFAATLIALPARADPPPIGALIAAISLDWNGDGSLDAATLTRAAEGMADLTLYRGGGLYGLDPVLSLPGVIFAGPMAGQAPGFAEGTGTGFAILTEQTGIGRTPWFRRVTVAYRDGGFLVAGFTYDFYDRLDLGHFGTCDVNLLTGDYELRVSRGDRQEDGTYGEGSAVEELITGRTDPAAFPLTGYTQDYWPEICDALF